jgi:soluble lytic murein transglycosylase-like protein
MAPSHRQRAACRRMLVAAGALVAVAALEARAQVCGGALPDSGAIASAEAGRFALIESGCQLAPNAAPRAAAQLLLYERGSATIMMSAPPDALVGAARAARPAPAPAPDDRYVERILSVEPAVAAAARMHGVDPLLLHAIAHVESRHRAAAVSAAGALGLTQVMPATARRFGIDNPERSLFDPDTNLRACAAYLRALRGRYGDDLTRVLAAYNAGEEAVDRHGGVPPYPETQAYVHEVLAVYARLTAAFAVSDDGALVARGERQ